MTAGRMREGVLAGGVEKTYSHRVGIGRAGEDIFVGDKVVIDFGASLVYRWRQGDEW